MQKRQCKSVIATAWVLLLAFMLIFQGGAHAATMIDATNPTAIVNMLKQRGSAKLDVDSDGDPHIEARIDGINYSVNFYSCRKGKNCQRIQFRASWKDGGANSLEDINDWNAEKIFGKAYRSKSGSVMVEMPVLLNHGVSEKNLGDVIQLWYFVVKEFRDYLR